MRVLVFVCCLLLLTPVQAEKIATKFSIEYTDSPIVAQGGYIVHDEGQVLSGQVVFSGPDDYVRWFQRPTGDWNSIDDFAVDGFWWISDWYSSPAGPVQMTPTTITTDGGGAAPGGGNPGTINIELHHQGDFYPGDANMDGLFNSEDLVWSMRSGKYEVNDRKAWWEAGDFTGDYNFNSTDLVLAFQGGQYEQPAAAVVVPEPSAIALMLIGLVCLCRRTS